jgi:hypothetical protein
VRFYPCVVIAGGFHFLGVEEAIVIAVDLS